MSVAAYLTYEAAGTPFTICRITDLEAIKEIARLAIAAAEVRIAACAEIDQLLAETERLELVRLNSVLTMLLGQFQPATTARHPQPPAVGVM
jgi:hypothetical protein